MILNVFRLEGERMLRSESNLQTEGSRGTVGIAFATSAEWDGMFLTARFEQGDAVYQVPVVDGVAELPSNLTAGGYEVSLHGSDGMRTLHSDRCRITLTDTCLTEGEEPTPDPETYFEQVAGLVTEARDAALGAEGNSEAALAAAARADAAAERVGDAASEAEEAAQRATNAAAIAGTNALEAKSQAAYAKSQADYAKAQGDIASEKVTDLERRAQEGEFDGSDGISPTATAERTEDGVTVTITDKDGTTSANLHDGEDGHSPVITAVRDGNVTVIYSDGVEIGRVADGVAPEITAALIMAALGYSPLRDTTVNGTSVVKDGTAEIPLANWTDLGLVRLGGSSKLGIGITAQHVIFTQKATDAYIDARENAYNPIVSSNLDYAVKAAMTDGKGAAWSDAEKLAARERLGLGGAFDYDETIVLTEETWNIELNNPALDCLLIEAEIHPNAGSVIGGNVAVDYVVNGTSKFVILQNALQNYTTYSRAYLINYCNIWHNVSFAVLSNTAEFNVSNIVSSGAFFDTLDDYNAIPANVRIRHLNSRIMGVGTKFRVRGIRHKGA